MNNTIKKKLYGRGYALRIVGVTVLIILLFINNAAALLSQECGDRNFIINTSSHIVEGTVEKVESKWNEGNTSIYTYTNISIEKYVKGVPIPGNKVQMKTYGGVIGEVVQWGEDEPVFREGKKVRVYLQENNGEFSVVCAEFGVEEIFTDNITGISPDERWNKTFGGIFGSASSVQQTTDGGYILAGSTKSYGAGEMDEGSGGMNALIVKTDTAGNEMWNKTFGGTYLFSWDQIPGNDNGKLIKFLSQEFGIDWLKTAKIERNDDGRTIIVSNYEDENKNISLRLNDEKNNVTIIIVDVKTDKFIVKMENKQLNIYRVTSNDVARLQTSAAYYEFPGAATNDVATFVQQTKDGGYIIAGNRMAGYKDCCAWLIKTDAQGNERWNKTFGVSSFESVQQTSDGGYIVAGTMLIKTDANGNQQWNRTFKGLSEYFYSVRQTSDGGYVLVGFTFSNVTSGDTLLIKTDASGNEQWNNTFGGKRDDGAYSVEQTNDGGYILAGSTASYGAGQDDAWLIKTDAKGDEMWNKTFGGMFYDYARSVHQTPDDGYILAGSTKSYGAIQDAWLIKTNASGNIQWSKITGGAKSDSADSIQVTRDGGYIIAGSTASYGAGPVNAWLIKVGGEAVEPTKIPTASQTRTPIVNPTEKAPGFGAFLAITILLALYVTGRKRR
ncbi:MAG: hypothetical protein OIN66_04885 [Candidatus Methanoperedens sp.]|nr:hypothetical protein [Candidatus Methanoperedens sp.]